MTIYSQHPNRGKHQVLATYLGSSGVVSSTVTSVDDATLAERIVDTLNRVSACATMPVSVYDRRDDGFRHYPTDHLAATIDAEVRNELLTGAHSLWYEHAKMLLHQALGELDNALAVAPPPVRLAVGVELQTDIRDLRARLLDYSEGVEPGEDVQREWDFDQPFVHAGELATLGEHSRSMMNHSERNWSPEELELAIQDLRLLHEAYQQTANANVQLDDAELTITDEPDISDDYGYYLTVRPPLPDTGYRRTWQVAIGRWEPDDPDFDDDEGSSSSTGNTILTCALPSVPSVSDVVALLNLSGGNAERLTAWAATTIGATLDGTAFVVTERPSSG